MPEPTLTCKGLLHKLFYTPNLKTSVTNLQAAVALNKSNIATNASNISKNAGNISKNASDISSNKGAIDALRSQVQSNYSALSQKIAENTSNITSINNRLNGAEFVKNGGANKSNGNGISLDYSNSDQKLHAYYNGSEVPLGSSGGGSSPQDGAYSKMVRIPKDYICPSNGFVLLEHYTHDAGSLDITIDDISINFSNHAWNGGAGGLATLPVYKGAHIIIPIDHDNEKWAPGGTCVGYFVPSD